MNSFSTDQMLLPSIGSAFPLAFHPSLLSLSDEEMAFCDSNSSPRPDSVRPIPKMLTPPDSPVFSELTTATYLLKMPSHEGSQMVPNLDGNGMTENGFHSNFIQSLQNLESLDSELASLEATDITSNTSTTSDDMFEEDTESGHGDWPGCCIYIDDPENNSDQSPPSPPSHPFNAPCFYEAPDINIIDSLLFSQDQASRSDRRKHSVCTEVDSLHSDSGSELGSCPSPTVTDRPFHSYHGSSKSGGRTHNYQRRVITKSLTELKEEGSKSVSSSMNTERRKRGRPRKRLSGELGEREGASGRRRTGRKAVKGSHLWEFILETLKNEAYCPQYIKWEDKDEGVFRIVNSKVVASMWGEIKNNPRMTYEKLSRAMRYYYKRQILERVDKARLVYKFGEKAEGWKEGVADE